MCVVGEGERTRREEGQNMDMLGENSSLKINQELFTTR
jgi:hypothetical protein